MSVWFRVRFEHALTHAVSASLLASLVIDLSSRGQAIENFERLYGREHAKELHGNPSPISDWGLDIGGMWVVGQPEECVHVDGLNISVASEHVDVVARVLDDAKIRRFDDGTWYYKLKFWIHATVLSVDQHDELLRGLEDCSGRARRRAREFFAARQVVSP